MDQHFVQLVFFGILAAVGNVFGGLLLFPSRLHPYYQRFLKYLLALSAGFMLAVTFFEILPKVFVLWSTRTTGPEAEMALPMGLILAGYLITQFFEHTIAPHLHLGGELHCNEHDHAVISPKSAYTTIAGLLIHTFFDGISIAAVSQIDFASGFLVFLAVLLHKFPEGFTVGSLVIAAGKGSREVLAATAVVGSTTIAGVIVFMLVGSYSHNFVAYALPLAAGVTLYVAASDLVPEVNHHAGKNPLVSLCVLIGVGVFLLTEFLLHQAVGH